jgi:hypothetical protein
MTQNQAWNLLVELLAHKGQLKVITSEVDENRPPNITPLNPAYFVQHDVVKIEVTKVAGKIDRLRAYTEEGDYCEGLPLALLHKLTEHNVLGIPNTRG